MSSEAERNILAAQAATMPGYSTSGGALEGSADNSDSDDYEPSATLQEDYSVPFTVSQEQSTATHPSAFVPESSSVSHTLPSAIKNYPSSTPTPQESSHKQSHSSNTSLQKEPRTVGGFVVDDDDDEEEEDDDEDEDSKDMLDVYGAADEAETEAAAPSSIPQDPVNSSSTSHVQIHDAAPSNGVSNGAPGVVLSSVVISSSNNVAQPGHTVNPIQTAATTTESFTSLPKTNDATPTSAVPKMRLAHDTIGILEDRIKEDPRGDLSAWQELLNELKSRNKKDDVRKTYERFLKIFPLAAEQWVAYAEWENENNQLYNMEQIFGKSLLSVPDVKLWSMYVSYIRRRNSMTTGDVAKSYKIISDAFNFALNNVGMDKDSGQLWQDYVDFVKSGPGVVGGVGWQDTQKMDALRLAYHKAIAVPMSALNSLWKEYDVFETSMSKINGRKFLQERSPAYMTARSCYTQLQNITRELERTTLPKLPPAPGFDGDLEYSKQVELWKGWIRWEKEDNLVLKDEDIKAYRDRVVFVYKQALMALEFWPEIWYDAADFCFASSMEKEGLEFLNHGIAANPESCLLAFRLADQIELTTVNDEISDKGAKLRMQKVREPYDKVLDALYDLITKAKSRETQDIKTIEMALSGGKADLIASGHPYDDEDERDSAEYEAKKAAAQAQIELIKTNSAIQVSLLQKTLSFAWVALMRACRRIQGKGMQGERAGGFRTILTEARKRGKITSDVYIQSALIEYHCYKDNTATKIFERGIKLFPDDEIFALEYIKHLIAINDITNARAVFETTVGRLTAKPVTAAKAKPIFAFLHEYESHFGELSQVTRLEQRMRELYPEDLGLKQFSQRFVSPTFDPTTVRPIISAQQVKPKELVQPSIEAPLPAVYSPQVQSIDSFATNSPKRPFPIDEFEDFQPRKFARGESPLKGAAGRRMDQQKRQNLNGHATSSLSQVHSLPQPLPGQINFLLSIIPKASTYVDARFDPVKLVELIREVRLPPPGSLRHPEHQPPPGWPPQFQVSQPAQIPPGFPQGGMVQNQYGGPLRYP